MRHILPIFLPRFYPHKPLFPPLSAGNTCYPPVSTPFGVPENFSPLKLSLPGKECPNPAGKLFSREKAHKIPFNTPLKPPFTGSKCPKEFPGDFPQTKGSPQSFRPFLPGGKIAPTSGRLCSPRRTASDFLHKSTVSSGRGVSYLVYSCPPYKAISEIEPGIVPPFSPARPFKTLLKALFPNKLPGP